MILLNKKAVPPRGNTKEPLHLAIDSSDMKVYSEGEWKTLLGRAKYRKWLTVHIVVDGRNDELVSTLVSEDEVADNYVFPSF